MVAAKLVTLKLGDNQHSEGLPIGRGSELLNVGERSVARAREVRERGTPELVHAVEHGVVSVSAAADIATESPEQQREIVACGVDEILEAAKRIRANRAEVRRTERIQRLIEISKGDKELPTGRRFPVLLADPPWHVEVYNEISGVERAAGNHYPTMSTEAIGALQVTTLATDDAVLFLWTTSPHLHKNFRVITACCFNYRTNIVWVKDRLGLGYYVRNQHELLLVATRGNIPCPAQPRRPPSVFEAPRGGHSEKPFEAYELIERMYPELPKIELFARNAREGWAAWGNQAPPHDDGLDISDYLQRAPGR
jgi:N6-adenosine-specific RNA methylase IME4